VLASSWIELDGKNWAGLKEIRFGDAVALAPILLTMAQHHDQSMITVPTANVDSVPNFGQQAKLESKK
jgi:hypothetical protein